MAYTRFLVRHFRGLGELELRGLGRINLISGRNDVGKTALLEAIYLHACGPFAALNVLQVIKPLRGQPAIELTPASSKAQPWSSIFERFDTGRSIDLDGTFRQKGTRVSLSSEAQTLNPQPIADLKSHLPIQNVSGELAVAYKPEGRREQVYATRVTAPNSAPNLISIGPQLTIDPPAQQSDVIPAMLIRGTAGADLAQAYSKLRQSHYELDLVDVLRAVDDRIDGLEVLALNNQPSLFAQIRNLGLVPMGLLGDGPVAIARYLLGMIEIAGGVLLIDEIENGIHWSVLGELFTSLREAAQRFDVQVFATTHSRECLLAAADALDDTGRELTLYRLRRSPEDEVAIGTYDREHLVAGLEMNLDLR